jgi:hypothetical protein
MWSGTSGSLSVFEGLKAIETYSGVGRLLGAGDLPCGSEGIPVESP